ncbi:DUF1330 domain-containing protein [Myxococcota bacterium]|nr:DUF1330 domain-containing protein [Myxococcota bacterium]
MSVYFIAQVRVDDAEGYARYAARAGSGLVAAGGKVLTADDSPVPVEGEWFGPRTVVIEFESEEAFRGWYDSPDYQEAVKLRFESTESRAVLVHGLG